MCGIAGILNLDGAPASPGSVDAMLRTLTHRGPDDRGSRVEGPCVLGHRRLSIIDVQGGHQPMTNEDGSLWITFNGEIFNYIELRAWLEQRGHRFTTHSDTEVILHLYEEKGEDCVHDLNGQWAFAIWDGRRRTLFLSRDRIGVRPIYYAFSGRRFLFASEMKALCAHGGVDRSLDLKALDQILTFWVPLAPRTILRGVSELPPGHSLSIDEEGRHCLRRYWHPDYQTAEPASEEPREERCAEQLLELLVDATRIRLRSDVPVGVYLSGGIDSSVITAIVKSIARDRLRSFSVTFSDPDYDESAHQDEVVRHLQTDHSRVPCSTEDIARVFPDVVWHAERPIVRTAPAPLYLLSRLVRNSGYKVVLTGEGADEMLGGYDIFKEAKIRAFWAAQPNSSRRPQLLKRLYPYLPNVQSQPEAFLQGFFRVRAGVSNCFFSHLPRWELTSRLKLLYSDQVRADLNGYDVYDELKASLPPLFASWDGFSRAQYLETAILLPGYILSSQGDRVAMAHSVETRFPFLDYRVVQFAASLPPRLKMRVLNEKYILKRAAGHLIPPSVRKRPKQPYRAPEAASFVTPDRKGRLPEYVETLLSPERVRQDGIFDPPAVSQLLAKARAGKASGVRDNMALVSVLSTGLVIDRFVTQGVA
jgi:asparagine synthase (glutamine-hydrolysing)